MEREGFIAALLPICDFVCEYDRRREKLRVRRSEIAPELAGSRWYTVDALSDALLRKPGPLTPEEFDVVKTHTTIGENLLRSMKDYTDPLLVECLQDIQDALHHEVYTAGGAE